SLSPLTRPDRFPAFAGMTIHFRRNDGSFLFVFLVLRIFDARQPFFEVVAEKRQREEILCGPFVVRTTGFGDRVVPLGDAVGSAADPGQRNQIDLLIDVEAANISGEFLCGGVVGNVFQHIGLAVVGGIGTGIRVAVGFLGVEDAR